MYGEEGNSSSMMIFIVIAICCLSMISGGIGAYFLFSDSGSSDSGTSDSKKKEDSKKQEESVVGKIQFTTSTTKLTPEQQQKAEAKAEEVAIKTKPTNCNNMINDPQYKYIIDAYNKNGKFDDDQRNTAIVIVSKLYYPLNNKKQNLIQQLPDKILYNLLKNTICNEMSKDKNYNEVIDTFYTEWDTSKRNKAINILKPNMSAGIKPENLTNGQLYYILLGDSKTPSALPTITDTCRMGQPCSAYLESSDGKSFLWLDQTNGAYTIEDGSRKDNKYYYQFWPMHNKSTKNPPYYSKIDTDNEFKVFDAEDNKIHGTDISGLDNPNILQIRNQGDAHLRDPKNNYNIWTAYATDKGKGGSGIIK